MNRKAQRGILLIAALFFFAVGVIANALFACCTATELHISTSDVLMAGAGCYVVAVLLVVVSLFFG